jgi:hypothetical protein
LRVLPTEDRFVNDRAIFRDKAKNHG